MGKGGCWRHFGGGSFVVLPVHSNLSRRARTGAPERAKISEVFELCFISNFCQLIWKEGVDTNQLIFIMIEGQFATLVDVLNFLFPYIRRKLLGDAILTLKYC
jgi:hypothetical protein